ncbi:MAG: hypothetical protein LBT08_08550 [Synergistaceae bacterium]|jgi:hypothetical protein|nr:hypothetical protein [Synergistaceae bacterium]
MIKKPTWIAGTLVGAAITVLALSGVKLSIAEMWPAYFLVLLYMLRGLTNPKDLKDIYCGGVVGILWSYCVVLFISMLTPIIGSFSALGIVCFFSIFLLIVLNDVQPMLFNNYAFIYYLVAALYPEQKSVQWILTLLVGGTAFALMVIGGLAVLLKQRR